MIAKVSHVSQHTNTQLLLLPHHSHIGNSKPTQRGQRNQAQHYNTITHRNLIPPKGFSGSLLSLPASARPEVVISPELFGMTEALFSCFTFISASTSPPSPQTFFLLTT